MFSGKKKKNSQKKVKSEQEELMDILERKEKGNRKLDNVPNEIIAKAIKDLLLKD